MTAGAFWLTESGITADDRLGRVTNYRLVGLRGTKRQITKLGLTPADYVVDPETRAAELLERVKAIGFDVVKTKDGLQVAPARPSMTELVYTLVGSEGAYSLFSGLAHGDLPSIVHHQKVVEGMSDPAGLDRRLAQLQITVGDYRALAGVLSQTLGRRTVHRVADYFGWDRSEFASAFRRSWNSVLKPV